MGHGEEHGQGLPEGESRPVDLSGVEQIVMDEFAIQKGHRYATVIVEPQTKRVLWVGRGNGREDIRPFFELLGADGRRRLKAVAMDMTGLTRKKYGYQCPLVEIVFDLFHVVAKYGRRWLIGCESMRPTGSATTSLPERWSKAPDGFCCVIGKTSSPRTG